MRKFRIIEVNNRFYPQEKKWFSWKYLDNLMVRVTWCKNNINESECKSKEDAENIIKRRIAFLGIGKEVIHEYKQHINGK